MDEEERREKVERQSNAIYLEIGRFIVTFERLMRSVHDAIHFIPARVVSSKDHVAEQAQTFARLAKRPVEAVFEEFFESASRAAVATPKGVDLLREVVGQCNALKKDRNDAVHNTWMVGYAAPGDTDFSKVTGFRHAREKGGVKFQSMETTAEDFALLTERAKRLKQQVEIILCCAALGDTYESHLRHDESGQIVTCNLRFRSPSQ